MVKVNPLIKELQKQIAALEARLRVLESQSRPAAPAPALEEIGEETLLVIAAAVAAYLGERAHIRVVRLVPSQAWAQQGRVSIQASHRLA